MGCNCGTPNGFVRKWQHIVGGKVRAEFDSQPEANAAKAKAGGQGRIQRVTRKVA